MRDYVTPSINGATSNTRKPVIQANQFGIKSVIIQMIQQTIVQFYGLSHEKPNWHIINFLKICDIFKQIGVTGEVIRLRLFPFSRRYNAKIWLNCLA